MNTRYDMMKESNQKDSAGNNYPDVLSFDLDNIEFNHVMTYSINSQIVKRPYLLCWEFYKECQYDDLLYWLNNIGDTTSELVPGQELKIPSFDDIKKLYRDKVKLVTG